VWRSRVNGREHFRHHSGIVAGPEGRATSTVQTSAIHTAPSQPRN
jgi:hypothetical protein